MAMMGSGYERRPEPEAPAGPRLRVYELAKDLNVQPKDLLNKVRAMGIDVANHMSHLESVDVDRVRRAVDRERLENLEEVRLNDTVIRRRSKSAAGGTAVRAPAPAAPPPPAPAPAPRAPEPAAPVDVAEMAPPRRSAREVEVTERHAPVAAVAPPAAPAPAPSVSASASASAASPGSVGSVGSAAMSAAPAAATPTPDPSRAGLKTIVQPVVTGSAATGAFIQLPGTRPQGDGPVQRFEIKDRDEELRRLGRGALITRAPAGRNQFGRPGFGQSNGFGVVRTWERKTAAR
jgi:translation initiation factor IF-2